MSLITPLSELSNVEIDDPGLFKPIIRVEKKYNSRDYRYNYVKVQLKDKNDRDIELKNGSVFFNEKQLIFRNYLFGDAIYELITYIEPDSTYYITITLPDGDEYISEIHTPEIDITYLDITSPHDKNENLVFSWPEVSNYCPQKILYEYWFDAGEYSRIESLIIPIKEPILGRFQIDKSYFHLEDRIFKVELTLVSETTWKIPGISDTHSG